jgi:TolB protein
MKYILFFLLIITDLSVCAQTSDCKTVLLVPEKESAYPRLSKDEKKILFQSNSNGSWQINLYQVDDNKIINLTNDGYNNNFPDWSADNQWISFVSDRDGNEEIYLMRTDGSDLKRITNDPNRDIHPYFSPDGKYILFNSTRANGSLDIYRYTILSGKTEQLTNTPQNETCARYSPDMKSVVFLKNDDYSDDVYMFSLSNFLSINLTNTPLTTDGWPMFSSDGKWIYFSSMENDTYSIYRIKPDGTGKQQITFAPNGEEHARVYISSSGKKMIYNIRKANAIGIYSCLLTV